MPQLEEHVKLHAVDTFKKPYNHITSSDCTSNFTREQHIFIGDKITDNSQ